MALPVKMASDLAQDMAKKGISGSISLKGKPEVLGSSGSPDDEAPEKDADPMEAIAGDILDSIQAGDKAGLAKYLTELVDRVSAGSAEPDGDEDSADLGG
jgi:hypothetical protein